MEAGGPEEQINDAVIPEQGNDRMWPLGGTLWLAKVLLFAAAIIIGQLGTAWLPAAAQTTSGGAGGSGGAGSAYVNGDNYGTIIVNGGGGGDGGSASSSQGRAPSSGGGTLAPTSRSVRVINFVLTNRASFQVNLKFFSPSHVWPSDDRAYVLNTRSPTPFRLDCEPGERICFGAFYRNSDQTWGAGRYGERSCTNCCLICQSDREVVYNFALGD